MNSKNSEENIEPLPSAITVQIDALIDLLARKNADYGNAALSMSSLVPELDSTMAILVRMSDKIQRLQRLASGFDAQVRSETFNDTILDLAGYCILYLVSVDNSGER